MKILLIGNGAREHAMADALKRSPKCKTLMVFASAVNPGIRDLATIYHVGDLNDMPAIQRFADEFKPDFAVIGPEGPLEKGVVDVLAGIGIPCASPTQALSRLESSKSFTRELLARHKVPGGPRFRTFTSDEGMMAFASELGQIVVKADGLQGGKGVQVMGDHFNTLEEGVLYAKACAERDGKVVIEEKFVGQEFSLMSFCDGEHLADMPPIQDHKRAFEGDTGPNTGGMGTYSVSGNLPFLTEKDLTDAHAINEATARALKEEIGPYKGILYGGFIAVKEGVRLIEYNARLGDPEAMNALTLLETDLVEICLGIIHGDLNEKAVTFSRKATVCKYAVPEGYPTHPIKGERIRIGDLPKGVKVFYASVDEAGPDELILLGSRAVAFVGIADTLEEAERLAETAVASVEGPVFHRRDIGTKTLVQQRVDMMKALRGK
jgi:phosphoribosylamine--glycine ligase